MRIRNPGVMLILAFCVLAAGAVAQHKGGEDETGPYEVVPNWPQPPSMDGWTWGSVAAVWAESPDRVWVFQRGELEVLKDPVGSGGLPKRVATGAKPRWQNCLVVLDRSGKIVESWRQHDDKFVRPHRIVISPYDPQKHVWLVDDGAHQVFKFTHDGAVTVERLLAELVLCGTVNKVVDQLLALRERSGEFGEIVYAGMDWVDPKLAKRSMELMAEEVMPRVNQAIGAQPAKSLREAASR